MSHSEQNFFLAKCPTTVVTLFKESGPEAERKEYGTFILRAMVNNNYSPQEIFETLEEMNKDEVIQARCVILLTNNFLMADRVKELGKFLELAQEKLGKMAISRYVFHLQLLLNTYVPLPLYEMKLILSNVPILFLA